MPSFRDQPSTWLFVVASVVGVLALGEMRLRGAWYLTPIGIALGQIFVLAAWGVCGSSHRLLRGGTLVAASAGLAYLLSRLSRFHPHLEVYPRMLAITAGSLGAALAGAAVASAMAEYLRRRSDTSQSEFPRFPLIEVFGWTIVVAAGATLLRSATFKSLVDDWFQAADGAAFCAVSGMTASLIGWRLASWRYALPLLLPITLGYFYFLPGPHQGDWTVKAIAWAYVIAFAVCRRIDGLPRVE